MVGGTFPSAFQASVRMAGSDTDFVSLRLDATIFFINLQNDYRGFISTYDALTQVYQYFHLARHI
jgi:hypothetical protein